MTEYYIDLKKKILDLYNQKKFSQLEYEIESLGKLEELPIELMMTYAVSKSLNPASKKEDFVKAAYFFEKVYSHNKNNLDALYNLIIVSIKTKTYKYVTPHLIERHKTNNEDQKVIEALAKMNFVLGNVSESFNYLTKQIKVNPNYPKAFEEYLFQFNYINDRSQDEYYKKAIEFNKLPKIECNEFAQQKDLKNNKIKLAFLSADFKAHPVSFFLKGVLKNISKKDFELIAFSNLAKQEHDEMTTDLKEMFDDWYDIKDITDIEFINLSRSLGLDILIDLSGFTYGNRVNALRARCALIQISWLGYCNTTGLENIDYIIADPNLIKKEEEKFYSEKVLYLPKIWNVMSETKNFPNINNLPVNDEKIFTFGSFNNFAKLSNNTIKIWSKILNNSNSRLILKAGATIPGYGIENLKNKFRKFISDEKIIIINQRLTRKEHLKEYNRIDLALDPFPYPGVTTSFESIMMGVPVLTMKGFNFNSRCGESINTNLGMTEFIANNEQDYYIKAIELQKDLIKLDSIRGTLRTKALNSPLFDTPDFSKNFVEILKGVIIK